MKFRLLKKFITFTFIAIFSLNTVLVNNVYSCAVEKKKADEVKLAEINETLKLFEEREALKSDISKMAKALDVINREISKLELFLKIFPTLPVDIAHEIAENLRRHFKYRQIEDEHKKLIDILKKIENITDTGSYLNKLKKMRDECEKKLEEVKDKLRKLNKQLEGKDKEDLINEKKKLKKEIKDLKRKIKKLERQIAAKEREISSLKSRIKKLQEKIEKEKEEKGGSPGSEESEKIANLQWQLRQKQAELEKLQKEHGC